MRMEEGMESILMSARREPTARGIPEAQLTRLREALEMQSRPLPVVGDVIYALPGYGIADYLNGEPHLVCEVSTVELVGCALGSPRRENVRVLYVDSDGDVAAAWVEHWWFESRS